MTDWTGSSDQYIVDTESRYPDFSDMYTGGVAPVAPKPRRAQDYEQQYQYEQQGVPAYSCRCEICTARCSYPTSKQPMRRLTLEERQRNMYNVTNSSQSGKNNKSGKINKNGGAPNYTIDATPYMLGDLHNGGAILFVFMFLIIIFICCFYTKTLSDLKEQVKSLKQMLKKN